MLPLQQLLANTTIANKTKLNGLGGAGWVRDYRYWKN